MNVIEQLKAISAVPSSNSAFDSWLQMRDAIDFLKQNATADEFVVYATTRFLFLHAVLVPKATLKSIQQSDLLSWNFNATGSWSVWTTGGETPTAALDSLSREDVARILSGTEEERKYASFIAQDWKNKRVVEISCHPDATSNYFTESDLPLELSPAFFRADVLTRYKSNSEKYTISDRDISCRGTWHLKSYDINEAGQVHAYICDLRYLPYEEQLHWKAHNEPPKGRISKRAFTSDFMGEWNSEYDPLPSVKSLLGKWHDEGLPWWTLRDGKLPERINYPVTTSPDEWSNEILHLHQLVVEGFEERWLRTRAEALGRTPDPRFRSLKLLEECLVGFGFDPQHAQEIVSPLHQLNSFRMMKGHASSDAVEKRKQLLKEFGSYKEHFSRLCDNIDKSLATIEEAFRNYGAIS